MAYDSNLWVPADIPGSLMLPEPPTDATPEARDYIERLYQIMQRQQAQLSRVVKILDRFRTIVDADKPAATGSQLVWVDTEINALFYDKPGSPDAWVQIPWQYVVLANDFTTSLATGQSVTGLFMTPEASCNYAIEGWFLLRTADTLIGPRPGVTWPTGISDGAAWVTAPNGATSFAVRFIPPGTSQNAASTGWLSTAVSGLGTLRASLITGASPSGNFQITLQAETAGTNVTMKAGSWIRYRRVA